MTEQIVKFEMKPSAEELERRLENRRDDIADTTVPMKMAAIFLDQWVQRNFRSEGRNVGGWEPFAAGGRNGDTSAMLLQDTGRLRSSFLPFATKTNAGIGSDLPYSEVHEEGIGVPARRMLPVRSEVIKPLAKILDKHMGDLTDKKL